MPFKQACPWRGRTAPHLRLRLNLSQCPLSRHALGALTTTREGDYHHDVSMPFKQACPWRYGLTQLQMRERRLSQCTLSRHALGGITLRLRTARAAVTRLNA